MFLLNHLILSKMIVIDSLREKLRIMAFRLTVRHPKRHPITVISHTKTSSAYESNSRWDLPR